MKGGRAEARLAPLEVRGIRLGLDGLRRLLAELGDPQRSFPAVLVAGTNGKGSTAAMLAAIARAAGWRVGLYTSPHLEEVAERVRIDGVSIEDETLDALLAEVLAVEGEPTYFEAMTAAAFLAFARSSVDLAVLEVGLGGRLDATNVVEPVLSVVTAIDLDHEEVLGVGIERIAGEKAGIFRLGVPCVLAPQAHETAARVLAERATELGASLLRVESEFAVRDIEESEWSGQTIVLRGPQRTRPLRLRMRLVGRHQADNVATAVVAAQTLDGVDCLPRLEEAAIERGVAACRWPGRMERVGPVAEVSVVLEGAHNPSGIDALCDFLDERGEAFDVLFGALRDKDAAAMMAPLLARARRATLTRAPVDRALSGGELRRLAPTLGYEIDVEEEHERALGFALERAAPPAGPAMLVVCGSLYLVGAIRASLRQRFGTPDSLHQLFASEPERKAT